ncbi:hypothetical protein K1719_024016 [Acacia pycnantha]|nr:hypothetical protein K1719_024016 [Acacia pycnantha]
MCSRSHQRIERIDDEVNKWKSDVKSLITEVENLEEVLKVNNGCLRGWLPIWRRYCLCKKLAKTAKRMIDLTTKSDCFNTFSHHVIIPGIEYHTSQNFKLFNSTQKVFDQLWEALKGDGSFMIGLWGMGGSGKTTLVKEVGKKAKESQLFDRVVLTTISQSLDIRKIQDEIDEVLGIKLEEKTDIGRAKRIALRLQGGERILIILDDAWAKLNLEDIGIPFGGHHQRNFKVVLTTRRLDVCTLMECQKIIQLELLKEDEAWTLFQTHANVDDATKEDMARAIAMECQGLPIAIEAVGTCLKGKGIDEMQEMLSRLRNAEPILVDKGVRDAFACLELSYDYLATPEAKKLLLMCAIFPEDHDIDVEDLFRYGMGLDLYRRVDSFEAARRKVRTAVNHLIASSLLMRSSEFNKGRQEYVRMHDVVRDFALWKASKGHLTIMVTCTEELDKLIGDEEVNNCYAFSSWYNNNMLLQFLSQVHTPKLEFLLLHSRELLDISHATFEGTKVLKALIIICTHWRSKIELQPQSIQQLLNLRTLRLQNWNLHDISFVVSLTRLEILDLQGSEFARVPDGIEKLSKLKLLDLFGCRIDECCYKVIGRCSQLEELYVSIHCSHAKNENCYEYLFGLTALIKLRRYKLEIGEHSRGWGFHNEGTRNLCLSQLNTSMLGAIIKDLAQRATVIRFDEFKGASNSFMANVQAIGSMNELTKLYLQKCSEIECITDETTPHEDAIVPRLDELVLEDMHILKQLWRGPSPFSLFQRLKRLDIFNCPQLLNIFAVANCNLGNLKSLTVSGCPMLTSLFPVSAACTLLSLVELRIEDAPQIKFVFGENASEEQLMHDQYESQIELRLLEYLKLKDLPNLVGICSGNRYCPRWPSIKEINWRNCPNMKLQQLECHQLRNEEYKSLALIERIKLSNCGVESIFHYQIGLEEQIPAFQCLKELTLEECARLKFVFSAHICQNLRVNFSLEISKCNKLKFVLSFMIGAATSMLPQLSTLTVSDCSQMEEIFKCSNIEDHDTDSEREIKFQNMRHMELNNLPMLVNICQGFKLNIGGFKLNTRESCNVEVHGCPKLMPIRSATAYCFEERLIREYELKYSQLNNKEALNLPLSVLNVGELDIQSPGVEDHCWQIIGDDDQEETDDSEILRSEQQMVGGVVPTQLLSFQYLHSLEVTGSKKLKFLFLMSTIVQNSLPKLTSLTLSDCEELEVIFGHSGDEDANYGDTITLSSLKMIEITNLPNFKGVCQVGLQIQVELTDIDICNCPKFADSSLGSALQQLGTLSVSIEDLNVETSSNVNEEKGTMLISRAEYLQLEDSTNLIFLWEGPTFITFKNLVRLFVIKCRRLKCIFPSTVMRSLPCLETLRISECEELEEIMSSGEEEHNHFPNESSNNSFCFPQLQYLIVKGCRKLKWLFPSLPSTQRLPMLLQLVIKECSELKGLCNSEVEIHEEGFYNNSLPQLEFLTVKDCPIFSETTLAALRSCRERNRYYY